MLKRLFWNHATGCCKNGKNLASLIDDSVIMCDEIIEQKKAVAASFNKKK